MTIKTKFSSMGYLFPEPDKVSLTINIDTNAKIYLNDVLIANDVSTYTTQIYIGTICNIRLEATGYNTLYIDEFVIKQNTILNENMSLEALETLYLTINSGNDASFTIHADNASLYTNDNLVQYAIDWGDSSIIEYCDGYNNITHTFPLANTQYVIKIKSNNNENGWLRYFGFKNDDSTNKSKIIKVDGLLSKKMLWNIYYMDYVCYSWFQNCTNLTIGNSFNISSDFTQVGNHFCENMFNGCTAITTLNNFSLSNITYIRNYFCVGMFQGCSSLTTLGNFNLPQNITNSEDKTYFCTKMFLDCISLTTLNNFNLPQNINNTNCYISNYCTAMFKNCSAITTIENLKATNFSILRGDYNSLDGIYYPLYMSMFENCTSLKTGIVSFLSNWTNATQEMIDKGYYYSEYPRITFDSYVLLRTFYNCSAITENITVSIKPLSFTPINNKYTFVGVNSSLISTLDAKWK